MKLLVKLVLALITVAAAGLAHAQTANANFSGDVQESDFPCAIVLCFANPKGPTAESKCKPPVNWLIRNFIRKGKPWPKCNFKDKANTQVDYFAQAHVECPPGFTPEQGDADGMTVLTGVCLRPLRTCTGFQPSAEGGKCFAYNTYNEFGTGYTAYYEYTIPANGVTSYGMRVYSGAMDRIYHFNLGGGSTTNLGASILQKNNDAYRSSYGD